MIGGSSWRSTRMGNGHGSKTPPGSRSPPLSLTHWPGEQVSDTDRLRRAMIGQMTTAGALRTLPWIHAFASVPRHVFLRRFFRKTPDHSGWEPVSDHDPGWLDM